LAAAVYFGLVGMLGMWAAGSSAHTGTSVAHAISSTSDEVSVVTFGAKGDGVNDDTDAFQRAIREAAGKTLLIPRSSNAYRIRATLHVDRPLRIVGRGGVVLFDFPPQLPSAQGILFSIQSSWVSLQGVTIEAGTGEPSIPAGNRYAVAHEPRGDAWVSEVSIRAMRFVNLMQHSGDFPATATVMHAIYMKQVRSLRVEENLFDSISGSCVFLVGTVDARIANNECRAFGWSGVWLNNSNRQWVVDGNTFSGTTPTHPSYWGGAIDVMGQTADAVLPGGADEDGVISNNRFLGGYYRYGQVLRISSSRNVVVRDNLFDQCDVNNDPGDQNNLIVLTVRDVTLNAGPYSNITIRGNTFIAKGAGNQRAILALTSSGTFANEGAPHGVRVSHNRFVDLDAENYFASCIKFVDGRAGYRDLNVSSNSRAGRCLPP
jgi:hypothetical protein